MHPGHIAGTDAITWGDDMQKYYRFSDLKAAGIVRNRMTLSRWIKLHGFPAGVLLGPNTRAWRADEVERWLAERTHLSNERHLTDRSLGVTPS